MLLIKKHFFSSVNMDSFFLFIPEENKISGNRKAPAVLAFAPGRGCSWNKTVFQNAGCVSKVYMKNMSGGQ